MYFLFGKFLDKIIIISSINLLLIFSSTSMPEFSKFDPNSFSRPDQAIITRLSIKLGVDFEKKIFSGNVILTVKKVDAKATELALDSRDLKIESVIDFDTKKDLKYELSEPVNEFGSKLTIQLPEKEGSSCNIKITYQTSPNASGLQWLDPQQTAGKKYPFVFSQFQAIHARSVLPCQDTPYVKAPYTAGICAPKEYTVLMSAHRLDGEPHADTFVLNKFEQKVPVPSYLIAIAIGALESRKLGPRSHVWAEKETVEAAAFEFSDTEKQLKTAEDICGPYVWGIYDLLVLPPSFPFGGMENPCLTFVTPTLLAGDKSLVNVIAHEIAHSWTGNLVTNRNFEHFWLNEGFTMFLERKIIGRLTSSQEQDFEAYCGTTELKETIAELGANNPLTSLVVNLKNVHPDDSFSRVPYEKGHTLLRHLETLVGGPEKFEPFMRHYFQTYSYKSIDTGHFVSLLKAHFSTNPTITNFDWDAWLYKPGMPPVIPNYDKTLVKACTDFKQRCLEFDENLRTPTLTAEEFKNLSTTQVIQVLQELLEEKPQSVNKLKALQELFGFDKIQNSEIKFRWLRIGIKAHWEEKITPALEWINEVGRMKFVRPLYRTLYEWEEARPRAIENFKKYRPSMMHVVAYTVAKDLHLEE